MVVVTSSPASPIKPIGSTVNLTCTAKLGLAVQNVSVTVEFQWRNPDGSSLSTSILNQLMSQSTHMYASTVVVSSFSREQSGVYNCTATAIGSSSSTPSYLNRSDSISVTARFTTGIAYLIMIILFTYTFTK